jgi:copper chaperone CopZ
VESAVKSVQGVYSAYVDLSGAFAEIGFDENRTDTKALIEAVKSAGYEASVSD